MPSSNKRQLPPSLVFVQKAVMTFPGQCVMYTYTGIFLKHGAAAVSSVEESIFLGA